MSPSKTETAAAYKVLQEALKEEQRKNQILAKAIQNARANRGRLVIEDPDRDYRAELQELLFERLKTIGNPKFVMKNKEIVATFDEIGPRFKVKITGPFVRLRPMKDRPRKEEP
jgi:hypothetical protein